MIRLLRLRTATIIGTSLIAGIAIGGLIPRQAQIAPVTSRDQHRADQTRPRLIGRNVYSPIILDDEYVRAKHLAIVDILENQCRTTGENCKLSVAARQAMSRPK